MFLGTVVWCCYPWDASPWFHKVCCPESVPFSGFAVFNGIHIPPTNGARRVQSKICAGLRCAKVSQDAGGLVGNFYQTLWLWVYDALCIKTPHDGIAASFALVFWSEALSLDIACVLSPWLVSATTWPSSTRSRNQQCRSSEQRAVRQCRLFAFVMWENQE